MAENSEDSANPSELIAGRYRPERRLGSGGTATVDAAFDQVLGRTVAVKRLRSDAPGAQAERFRREARIGAGLNHPNLVAVYDIAGSEEAVLIVMEYVEGHPLTEELESGPLAPERALEILEAVAAALDHAHRVGVVHRDIKPANVLLGDDGRIKLVDLGIASAAEESRLTAADRVVGTLPYMAPERLSAENEGEPASDVYSLAMLALEMLGGHLPWRGLDPAERLKRAERGAPDVAAVWSRGPRPARAAIERSLDPDPSLRHPSARALVADLATGLGLEGGADPAQPTAAMAAVEGEAQTATEPAAAGDGNRSGLPPGWPRRHQRSPAVRALPAMLLAAVALLIAGAVALGGGDSSDAGGADGKGAAKRSQAKAGKGNGTKAPKGSDAPATSSGGEAGPSTGDPGEPQQPEAGGAAPDPTRFASGGPEDTARGSELNQQGYALIEAGEPHRAIPVLRRAVKAFPAGTDDVHYAYALYNLGNALRLAGQPRRAIPILEARLAIPNQTETVRASLEAAREAAGSAS